MKKIVYGCLIIGCLFGCNERNGTCDLDEYEIEHLKLQTHVIDTILIDPQNINVFQDKLLIVEPNKKNDMLSVFSRENFKYLYSGIAKGHARNEVLSLRSDYFACTDTSFFVLNRNEEKEYILKNDKVEYVGSEVITIPDALNEVLHVGRGKYITAGMTNGNGNEHLLFEDGEYEGFGNYPGQDLKDGGNFFFNGSKMAGMMGKDMMWGFYTTHPLIRSYDLQGNLLKEIVIKSSKKNFVQGKNDYNFYYYKIKWNKSYIAVVYNEKCTMNEFYSLSWEQRDRELQLWTWKGELMRRICFDKPYNVYTLSDDNIFYAMDLSNPNIIYTYDFNKK